MQNANISCIRKDGKKEKAYNSFLASTFGASSILERGVFVSGAPCGAQYTERLVLDFGNTEI